jgi:hypothetical protein
MAGARQASRHLQGRDPLRRAGFAKQGASVDGDAGKEQSARHQGAGGDYVVSLGNTNLTGKVRSGARIAESLGRVTLEAGRHEIRVSATRITGDELMRLRSLTLTPVATE